MDYNYSEILSSKISELRKKDNYTQEELANKLGITFQAVSKWENNLSCPDVTLLPIIANIFDISIDELFGKEKTDIIVENYSNDETIPIIKGLPWKNDKTLRAVAYIGHKLIRDWNLQKVKDITLNYQGDVLDVKSTFAITCGDVKGNAKANGHVHCKNVGGDVKANGHIESGNITGNVKANGHINSKDITNTVTANGHVEAESITGDIKKASSVNSTTITGNINASTVKCDKIEIKEGAISAKGNINAREIIGNIEKATVVKCTTITGNVNASSIKCDNIKAKVED